MSARCNGGVFIAILILVAAPIVPVIMQSFSTRPLYDPTGMFSLGGYARAVGSAQFWAALATTLEFSVIATLIAQVTGVATAILVARTDLPGSRLFANVMLWPIFISHLVLASAGSSLTGRPGSSLSGCSNSWDSAPETCTR
ncbi:MAG TPA: hypothetical protein VNS22_11420 [Geminicoccus sp.]|uniref:hypothetical protein n=1 Tax=Geminicoccus sp. TaxID=2024832 RepID=UPI002C0240FB|nr:hypothetical protein [Geminicoccus sp.]HWL68980.1 hypothetical protein [Geminicoccus sp.]